MEHGVNVITVQRDESVSQSGLDTSSFFININNRCPSIKLLLINVVYIEYKMIDYVLLMLLWNYLNVLILEKFFFSFRFITKFKSNFLSDALNYVVFYLRIKRYRKVK